MKNRMGLIILTLICVGLVITLIVTQTQSSRHEQESAASVDTYSNKWVGTSDALDRQIQVNTILTNDLESRKTQMLSLTNTLSNVSNVLAQTEASMKEEVAKREARISELEAQNQALDQRTADLSTALTNLTSQIEDTQKKLDASEGDKAFLEKELQRLMAEKAELERQFNDLTVLKTQVRKLREELSIARRLQWIREGVFARNEQKGAEQLMQKGPLPAPGAATPAPNAAAGKQQPQQPTYDLNVEVSADGTVRVIPPLTNNSATNSPPPQ